jgi:hypothetical protein
VHFFYSSSIQLIPFPHIQLNVQLPHLTAARAHFADQPVYPWARDTIRHGRGREAEEEEEEEKEEEKGGRKKKRQTKDRKDINRKHFLCKKKKLRRRVCVHSCNFNNSPCSLSLSPSPTLSLSLSLSLSHL